ncbi:MAG: FAD-dependent oxidoreductase [Myxococcaceae bacterium]
MTALIVSLVVLAVVALTWKRWVRALVEWRLGPYRVQVNQVDAKQPEKVGKRVTVAVVGGGLAGVAAARTLASRGYEVTLLEGNTFLGGKLGSWPVKLANGETESVSHGFHAFFRHYYNLNSFLDSLGLRKNFRPISDYRIVFAGGDELSFGHDLDATPILNLLSLARAGVYRLGDSLKAPTRDLMGVFLEYDSKRTFEQFDGMSFAQFDALAKLPTRLKLAFNTFARVFFADEHKLSLAELVKSFHFYFLGHDGGLTYDYPTADYAESLWKPIRAHLEQLNVKIELGARVASLHKQGERFTVKKNGAEESFDRVVLATDVPATRAILAASTGLDGISRPLLNQKSGQRYAVLRLWLDRAPRATLPVFVITDRKKLLDAITFYERTEAESAEYVKRHGGSVLELHSYAVPDDVRDEDVRKLLLDEMELFLPELKGAAIRDEHFQLRADFAAFHVGQHANRAVTDTGVSGLKVAGDWVKLEFPAMLMEAAFSSGLVAANQLFAMDGVREVAIDSVPLRGVLAGVPPSPQRKKLLGGSNAPARTEANAPS